MAHDEKRIARVQATALAVVLALAGVVHLVLTQISGEPVYLAIAGVFLAMAAVGAVVAIRVR